MSRWARIKVEVIGLITYKPFWRTMEAKNISTYKLEKQYGMSKSMIFKLKHDKNVNLATINELCKMFECNLLDVIEYVPDEEAEMK